MSPAETLYDFDSLKLNGFAFRLFDGASAKKFR